MRLKILCINTAARADNAAGLTLVAVPTPHLASRQSHQTTQYASVRNGFTLLFISLITFTIDSHIAFAAIAR